MSECETSVQKAEHTIFALNKNEFDQTTYKGRFQHFLNVLNPLLLIKSENDIREAQVLLQRSKNEASFGIVDGFSNSDMWQAQRLVQHAVQPDTGDIVPAELRPFRMGGFVTYNLPITIGIFRNTQGPAMTAFWQWANQTHNTLTNFANRNATTPVTPVQQLSGYAVALVSAMGISWAGNNYLRKNTAKMNPRVAARANKIVPFLAVAFGNCANTAATRNAELWNGIEIYNSNTGEACGFSKVAARQAIGLTCISRIAVVGAGLLGPHALTTVLSKANVVNESKRPRQFFCSQVLLCALCLFCAVPAALAIFPQHMKLGITRLEPELAKTIETEYVTYNKGL